MAYPGGKNGAGVFQTLINLMPPHDVYIEPFLGGAAIMRLKRPARLNIGLDLDSNAVRLAQAISIAEGLNVRNVDATGKIAKNGDAGPIFCFHVGDVFEFLKSYRFTGQELVYCDPPYMHATRSRTDLYRFEMTDGQHQRLLRIIRRLPCRVMISGYWTSLYADLLTNWHSISFEAMTRSGKTATEWLWFNFPPPVALHDYRYLGEDFRERERIKRKKARWVKRLQTMPTLEARALLSAIEDAWPEFPHHSAIQNEPSSM